MTSVAVRTDVKRRLRDAGLRATGPRVAVFGLALAASKPLSHSEVVEALASEDWDQATLYRNLIKLLDVGLLRVASRVGGIVRYEAAIDQSDHVHPHFACRDCGQVACLPGTRLEVTAEANWREALRDADLQIVGRCPVCRDATLADGRD